MKRHLLLLPSLVLLWSTVSFSQYAYLQVQHPQQTWRWGQGTIEEVVVSVKSQGAFTETGVYLTFSARGLGFSAADSVEVQFLFDMPEDASVSDLWLWIDSTTISRGLILDRWTASTIYENIVKRRRDPAILYRDPYYSNRYQLRVYPMSGTTKRRIKITYLRRSDITAKGPVSALPMYMIQASKYAPPKLTVLFWPPDPSSSPRIMERTEIVAVPRSEPGFGTFFELPVPSSLFRPSLSLAYGMTMSNGYYLQQYRKGSEGTYQLILLPSEALHITGHRKIAVLFDHDATKSSYSVDDVAQTVRSFLHENLAPADSFNLIFSRANIFRVSEEWLGGDSAGIEQAFVIAGPQPIANYSNLPALLANGIEFINHHPGGEIWVLANSDQVGDYQVANPLMNDLLKLMSVQMPVHFLDYNNLNVKYFYIASNYYYGNQYFYENLSRQTRGSNTRISGTLTLLSLLSESFQALQGTIEAFDLITTLENGFCYARLMPGMETWQSVRVAKPIIQIGKYSGDFPLVVQIAGQYAGQTFSQRLTIPESSASPGDSVLAQLWAGLYIATLQRQTATAENIRQVVEVSLRDRVLSKYTAFLALEPSDTIPACLTCRDETKLVPVLEEIEEPRSDSLLSAYPNPFNAQTTLRIKLPKGTLPHEAILAVYNVLGQEVRRFSTDPLNDAGYTTLTWDGKNDESRSVSSGIYFLVLSTPKERLAVKLLALK